MKLFKVKYERRYKSFCSLVVARNDMEAKRIVEEENFNLDGEIKVLSISEEKITAYPRLICTYW